MKTDWKSVIKTSEEKGLISKEESVELMKLAFGGRTLKALNRLAGGFKRNAMAILAGTALLPTAYGVGGAISKPILNNMSYNRMIDQLTRIAPDIVKKYDEKHLKTVYGLITHFAPVIASNPVTAAVAVRDNIMTPSQMDLSVIKTMTDIQHRARPTSATDIGTNFANRIDNAVNKINQLAVVSNVTP